MHLTAVDATPVLTDGTRPWCSAAAQPADAACSRGRRRCRHRHRHHLNAAVGRLLQALRFGESCAKVENTAKQSGAGLMASVRRNSARSLSVRRQRGVALDRAADVWASLSRRGRGVALHQTAVKGASPWASSVGTPVRLRRVRLPPSFVPGTRDAQRRDRGEGARDRGRRAMGDQGGRRG